MKLATTDLIAAPPETVFDLLADPGKQLLWRDGLVTHRKLVAEGAAQPGRATVDEVFHKGRSKTEYVIRTEIISSVRPNLYVTRISHESFSGEVTYRLDVRDGKTRLVTEADMTYRGHAVSRFLNQMAAHHNRKDIKALIALAEAESK